MALLADHLGRDNKDFAIEFGHYLAQAAEYYLKVVNACGDGDDGDCDDVGWADVGSARQALESAIYEFRKRAAKVENYGFAADRNSSELKKARMAGTICGILLLFIGTGSAVVFLRHKMRAERREEERVRKILGRSSQKEPDWNS